MIHPPIPPDCENLPDSKVDDCYWFHWSTSHGYIQCALCDEGKHAMAVKPYERKVIAAVAEVAWKDEWRRRIDADQEAFFSSSVNCKRRDFIEQAWSNAEAWADWGKQ